MGGACCVAHGLSAKEKDVELAEKRRSAEMDAQIAAQQKRESEWHKLLLLGAGESGKSTLFKQMLLLYGTGFSDEDKEGFRSIIFNNVLASIQTLVEWAHRMTDKSEKFRISTAAQESALLISESKLTPESVVDEFLSRHIQVLWADPGIQETFEHRAEFQLSDSTAYYLNKIDIIGSPNYLPSEQDVLRSRVRTTGIVENEFVVDNNQFRMFDVGGQRNERKKWIHCFEGVTAVIFVASISEYDQVLFEDENTNRMDEAMDLFEEVCNSRWFRSTSMILFLNKKDLFMEKVTKWPITMCFPGYEGPQEYDACIKFIEQQFQGRNNIPDKVVYSHITNATDTQNVGHVFNSVKDIVVRASLGEAGMI